MIKENLVPSRAKERKCLFVSLDSVQSGSCVAGYRLSFLQICNMAIDLIQEICQSLNI